jgi:Tfp pilus assembly protein PilX
MNARHPQRGATLIFVLILLVVLLIGGLSLVRSVDTGLIIAGNLAFKRSATHSADFGIEAARTWLRGVTAADLENDNIGQGYYATRQAAVTDFAGTITPSIETDDVDWDGNKPSALAKARNAGVDAAGNSIAYVIHRLCNTSGTPGTTGNPCESYSPSSSDKSSMGGIAYGKGALKGQRAYLYRITVRVAGPRDTRSIVQSVIIL